MVCVVSKTEGGIVVKAGWLVDGLGGAALQNRWFSSEDGKIVSVSDARPAGDYRLVDLSGYTVLPGLVDCHVHLFLSGSTDAGLHKAQAAAGFGQARDLISANIKRHIAHGVVAVRDGGDPKLHALRYKNEQLDGETPFFKIAAAGRAWYKRGRYGRFVGGDPLPDADPVSTVVQAAKGLDCVKLINSGLNSLDEFGKQTAPQFSKAELSAIVKGAHDAGARVMVHANGEIPVREAVEAGVDSIEHGYFMGQDNILRMADRGTFWVPTLIPMRAYADCGHGNRDVVLRTLDHQIEQLELARRAGVRIALGSDAGSPGVLHGGGVVGEIELLMSAGYTAEQAICCASSSGAALAGLDGLGRIEKGAAAVWVAARGDVGDLPGSLCTADLYFCA